MVKTLNDVLSELRKEAVTEREKGTYFEELVRTFLRHEPAYHDLYSDVWIYSEWADQQGLDRRDTGIDLVAKTRGTDEYHAIQCKFYAEDHRVQKSDIDSFFTASGKRPFSHRVIISTTNHWSEHADDALRDQQPPVSKIDLIDLENSQIDWGKYYRQKIVSIKKKDPLRPHQVNAVAAVKAGLSSTDRGKMIMACGSGKTYTSLRIAEDLAGPGGRVLFLVPSLSLLSQALTEWTQASKIPLHSFAVCSDSDVGKKRKKDDDAVQTFTHELRYPATTDPVRLASEMRARHEHLNMSVVFSTYHSIDVVSQAQHLHGLRNFDLIICDEAHRTTGATFEGEEESAFVRVHDSDFLRASKRLYMTATPRLYGDAAKASAEKESVTLCSMDDERLYGHNLHVLTFSEAVKRDLLVDYKVIVLAVEEAHINRRLQDLLKDEDNQLRVDDAAKIVGCWKALSKQGLDNDILDDPHPMRRAVAFCQVIEIPQGAKVHKVSSKQIAGMFKVVVDAYCESASDDDVAELLCEAEHIDGSMNASEKEEKLQWLKADPPDNTCRVLSNVRCLSEGVDVPALDAVLFLTPRNSQVDVVQSVGRVMRKAGKDKKRGYIILPVVIPAGVEPHEALNDNKTYKVVWQVLQALRSHDDRFDAMINKLDLIGKDPRKMEVVAVTDKIPPKPRKDKGKTKNKDAGRTGYTIGAKANTPNDPIQLDLAFKIGEIERAIYAKLVQKCGNRHHWEDWANDIAKIARTHIDRITAILENPANTKEKEAFDTFSSGLRNNLNSSINDAEVIEMLAQHLVTKPVFEALFEGYSFAKSNPMAVAMEQVLSLLQTHRLDKEADTLKAFYESVKLRAEGIDNAVGKQRIVVELYDKFFRNAFPRMTERLGIVYTPVEVVDFIINSVNHILQAEFGMTLGSKGVHILDPFTGTGTFVTRLLQSGLIGPEELPYKYKNEIHANEIVLLAYYIAAINIEAVYHGLIRGDYQPFDGICLADTFQMSEHQGVTDYLLEANNARRSRQKKLDIKVIMGNPPYSAGQTSANDNNQNVAYPLLDERIRGTYAKRSTATNKNALYDSYIRAIRWASDRIGNSGVIGFVTNAGFVEANTADGLRQCLAEEFSNIYVFHLRGNQRTSGELSRKEGGKIFGSGSRAPIAISLFVKNPEADQHGRIFFHDIGDYLTREEKLEKISGFASVAGLTEVDGWRTITPDPHGDWLEQRDTSFERFISLGDKKDKANTVLFENYSSGIKTQRDAWCYNASKISLERNMQSMISFYNTEVEHFNDQHKINMDPTKISWSVSLNIDLRKFKKHELKTTRITNGLYRPFLKQWLYYDRNFNERVYQMPKIFPDATSENLVITINANHSGHGCLAMMANVLPDLHFNGDAQCFPLYLYDEDQGQEEKGQRGLFKAPPLATGRKRRDAITDEGLAHFQEAYPGEAITKEDLFYYIYGILHSPEYRERYAANLSKELPGIPRVKTATDFWSFSLAGRKLAELHLNYETVKPYPVKIDTKGKALSDADYRVEKMRYGKEGKTKDLTSLHYNSKITITGIPLEAYEYVVNGKPALDWVVERQRVKTDKASGIINDANDWAIETMSNPRYPLELLQRVITVSLETMKIVNDLPKAEYL